MDKSSRGVWVLAALGAALVQPGRGEVACHVSNWSPESLQCAAVGNRNNIISKQPARSGMVHTVLVGEFSNYRWDMISTLLLKDLRLLSIDKDLFANASRLVNLDLSGNPNLCFVGDEFAHLAGLQTLRLAGTGKCAGRHLLEKVPGLYSLDLSDLRMTFASLSLRDLVHFKNLRVVDLSRNTEINFAEFNVRRTVRYLNASYTRVRLGNLCFIDARELRTLLLGHAELRRLPADAFRGTSLDELDLSYNSLGEADIASLARVSVRRLNLSHNSLKELGRQDMFGAELQVLDLSHNALNSTHLEAFWLSSNLTHLNLAHNNLSWLYEKQLNENYNLKTLDLSYNAIQSFYNLFFSNLENLEILNLAGNGLYTIDQSLFENNPKLDTLLLNDNRLISLNILTFVPLKNLRTLDVSNNQLKRLPDNLPQVGKMRFLRAACNKVSYLPINYFKGKFGLRVSLHGNPWKCGCILPLVDSLQDVTLERKSFLEGGQPTCYVSKEGSYSDCNDDSLGEEDYSQWDRVMSAASVKC